MLEDSQQRQLVRDLFTYNAVCRSSSDGTLQTIGSYSLETSHTRFLYWEGCSREGARQAKWFIETQTRKGTSPCKKKRQATKMLGKRQIIIIVISFNLTR